MKVQYYILFKEIFPRPILLLCLNRNNLYYLVLEYKYVSFCCAMCWREHIAFEWTLSEHSLNWHWEFSKIQLQGRQVKTRSTWEVGGDLCQFNYLDPWGYEWRSTSQVFPSHPTKYGKGHLPEVSRPGLQEKKGNNSAIPCDWGGQYSTEHQLWLNQEPWLWATRHQCSAREYRCGGGR